MSFPDKNGKLCEYCQAKDSVLLQLYLLHDRAYPNYSKLPDSHHLPGTKTPTSGRKPNDYQP